jgi:AraC family transcriptional regulator
VSYVINKKRQAETPILFIRRRVTRNEIAQALGKMLPGVHSFATKNGIPLAGPPLCRYLEWDADGGILEAGMPVTAPVDGEGEVLAGTLPAGPAAVTIHHGPYDQLPQAHAVIEAWLAENSLRPAGAPWEVYLTDPGELPNPAEWQTEVIWPTDR